MFSLMLVKCFQVTIIVYGAKSSTYYDDNGYDGFAALRYVSAYNDSNVNFLVLSHSRAGRVLLLSSVYPLRACLPPLSKRILLSTH